MNSIQPPLLEASNERVPEKPMLIIVDEYGHYPFFDVMAKVIEPENKTVIELPMK